MQLCQAEENQFYQVNNQVLIFSDKYFGKSSGICHQNQG